MKAIEKMNFGPVIDHESGSSTVIGWKVTDGEIETYFSNHRAADKFSELIGGEVEAIVIHNS